MYDYISERPNIFTEDGVALLLQVRDAANELVSMAGAATLNKVINGVVRRRGAASNWDVQAAMDYLCERGEFYGASVRHETIYLKPREG